MASDDTLLKAVNGWDQAVGIIRRLKPALEFALAEITRVNKEHPQALGESSERAAQYQEAVYALDTAVAYIAAMDRARS